MVIRWFIRHSNKMFFHEWKYTVNPRKFDEIQPKVFENYRIRTVLSYAFNVWFLLLLKVAFLVSDFYTCIKLLAYNSWSNNVIKPYLPFNISKWLFSGCIFASICLLLWEIIAGIRVFRSNNIALCYVNKFSRLVYSVISYSKFCLMDRITPTTKFERWAFFVFFEIKDCLGLLIADTPRQVINALTLWSVVITKSNSNMQDLSELESFQDVLSRIRYIAKYNHTEAVLLSFMLFSFAIWLFFICKLFCAIACSPFIYYSLIKKGNYSGLREYVCLAISARIDDLLDVDEKLKRDDSISSLSSNSMFLYHTEDNSTKDTLQTFNSEYLTNAYNDGASLVDYHQNDNSKSTPTKSSFVIHNQSTSTLENDTDFLGEPQRPVSVVYANNPNFYDFAPKFHRPRPRLQIKTDPHSYDVPHIMTPKDAYFK